MLNFLLGLRRVAVTTGLGRRATLEVSEVNHEPAVVVRVDGQLDGIYVLSIEDGAIAALRIVRNPDKLRYIDRQLATSRGVLRRSRASSPSAISLSFSSALQACSSHARLRLMAEADG